VRVSGTVVPGSIKKDLDGSLEFKITDDKQSINVKYKGIIPDIFRDGVQAVVEGSYTPESVFQAKVLLAKCPTKYEPAGPLNKKGST
jgi:cytochrome c-type biogenesis protein CcmE